jgi:hypothetical protein|mmetsp:Transcript_31610/g.53344  ORF Transcript_31610/g.53344 Transcript_31610/m.53344 type:complete len:83 (-) Transcript_31610:152-400(-)
MGESSVHSCNAFGKLQGGHPVRSKQYLSGAHLSPLMRNETAAAAALAASDGARAAAALLTVALWLLCSCCAGIGEGIESWRE